MKRLLLTILVLGLVWGNGEKPSITRELVVTSPMAILDGYLKISCIVKPWNPTSWQVKFILPKTTIVPG